MRHFSCTIPSILHRGWKADSDWFVANDRNVIRVLEGRYDSGARASLSDSAGSVFDKIRVNGTDRKDEIPLRLSSF